MKRLISYVLVFVIGFGACAYILHLTNNTQSKQSVVEMLSQEPKGNVSRDNNPIVSAAAKVGPSVVSIYTISEQLVPNPYSSLFGPGLPPIKRPAAGAGSGVIISKDGYILTNNHVVANVKKIGVRLKNGNEYEAKLVGRDNRSEVAVIKIDAKDLPVAEIGNSDSIRVGDWAIAVGNPFGQLENTVTVGVISAARRKDIAVEGTILHDLIQTDASINPGNSGGALCDIDGRVIGINTMIQTPTGASVGLGFAIPINAAKELAVELVKHGEIVRPYMGVVLDDLSGDLATVAARAGYKEKGGAVVVSVVANGPAAKSGVEDWDIISEMNGVKIHDSATLIDMLGKSQIGSEVNLTVWKSGKTYEMKVKLEKKPKVQN